MTLSTSVHPLDPIDHRELFLLARRAANIPAEWPFEEKGDDDGFGQRIMHVPGLPGARCRVDAFHNETAAEYEAKWGEAPDESWREGWIVQFDTPYGCHGPRGETCDDTHGDLVRKLLVLLAERGVRAEWQDEYTGEWYDDPPMGPVHVWQERVR